MGRFSQRRYSNDARGNGSHGTSPKPVCMRRPLHYHSPGHRNSDFARNIDRLNRIPEVYPTYTQPYNSRRNS